MRKSAFLVSLIIFLFLPGAVLAATSTPTLPPFSATHAPVDGDPMLTNRAQACLSTSGDEQLKCANCVNADGNWTVFGCLPTDPNGFAAYLLRFSLGVGGGIAFLSTLFGGFYLLTSAGNPERINQGKKIIFYSITGILVILFAVFILQFLGIQILGIPEFGQ